MTTYHADKVTAHTRGPSVRLFNYATECYLHLTGEGETPSEDYSWSGLHRQADRIKANAIAKGKPWPYKEITILKEQVGHY